MSEINICSIIQTKCLVWLFVLYAQLDANYKAKLLKRHVDSRSMHILCTYNQESGSCSITAEYLLVEKIEADAVVSLADNVIAEYRRVPAVSGLLMVGLLT